MTNKVLFLLTFFILGTNGFCRYFDNEIDRNIYSEVSCEIKYCINGVYVGDLRLKALKKKKIVKKYVYFGYSMDCHNTFNKTKKMESSLKEYSAFIEKLYLIGMSDLCSMELESLPINENSETNPWEKYYFQFPNVTNLMIIRFCFISYGVIEKEIIVDDIFRLRDNRYSDLLKCFNEYFHADIGGRNKLSSTR
jgi:hypothetical protein